MGKMYRVSKLCQYYSPERSSLASDSGMENESTDGVRLVTTQATGSYNSLVSALGLHSTVC